MLLAGVTLLAGCMTYYQRNLRFHTAFESGNLKEAESLLLHDKRGPERNTRLLYYLNRGVVLSMMGSYSVSNEMLEQAWILSEDYSRNIAKEGLALVSNPNATEYRGEDHELMLINYYKALNYLKMQDTERALVEVRRMNLRLQVQGDKYKAEHRYKEEPFLELMQGLVYDAAGETNAAFVAYRNAYEAYKRQNTAGFGPGVPAQLTKDLLRTAWAMGFDQELRRLEKEIGTTYKPDPKRNTQGEVVFLWHNGLGPVKSEWSINFQVVKGQGGSLMFVNEQMALNFPAVYVGLDANQQASLTDLEVVRVAFPKYLERKPFFDKARVKTPEGTTLELEQAMDVNQVAFRCLDQRMLAEIGKAITRLAVKQALQYAARKGTEAAAKGDSKDPKKQQQAEALGNLVGFAVGVANAVTEKADTRAWMTLPHSIGYVRLPVMPGKQTLTLEAYPATGGAPAVSSFEFDIRERKTVFHSYQHIQTRW
jgi:hypothetical protein